VKEYKTLSVILKTWTLQENGIKELKVVLFESLLLGLHILFYNIFGQTTYWSKRSHERAPKMFERP
jgi:hypothetical protein